MGFDVMGVNPVNETGEYFRNNVWYWRPLWDYIVHHCSDILTDEDITAGSFNDGHLIDESKALAIAARLKKLLDSGETDTYSIEYKIGLESMPEEECVICGGTGVRDDAIISGECNGCKGKGTRPAFSTNYPFDIQNVRNFMEFCGTSGGFEIC